VGQEALLARRLVEGPMCSQWRDLRGVLTRVVVNLLYEVTAGDPLTYACFKPNHYPEASFSPRPTSSWM
jgi:hypothetical protein